MSQRRTRSAVWKFFTKTDNNFLAKCSVCQRDISYKTTIANLGSHLKNRHIDQYLAFQNYKFNGVLETSNGKDVDKPKYEHRGRFWNYYKYIDDDNAKKAQCNLCDKIYCLSGNNDHLKTHLKTQHHTTYLDLYKQRNKSESADNSDDDSNSSMKFSSEIWSYFELVEDGARCKICEKTTENSIEEMRNHLEEDHPGILISILNNKEVDTDAEEIYTEVVYLEEEKRTPKAPKRKKTYEPPQITEKKTCNETSRPDLDTFLNYLGTLLRNVPKETMPKLQLDVISCVLKAQMNPKSNDCNCKVASAASHGEYQIIIDSGKIVDTNIPTQ